MLYICRDCYFDILFDHLNSLLVVSLRVRLDRIPRSGLPDPSVGKEGLGQDGGGGSIEQVVFINPWCHLVQYASKDR